MAERSPIKFNDLVTFLAYSLTSIAMASAWYIDRFAGLWLGNAIAATIGITLGLWAIRRQSPKLFSNWKRELLPGVFVGLGLVLFTQLGTRWVLLQCPVARQELTRLYTLLETPPGPTRASPVLLLVVVAEELVFRGAVTTYLQERFRPVQVAVLATGLYTLPLIASGSWLLPLVGVTLGGVWTIARQRSHGLTIPLLCHALFSLTTFVWLPIS